MVHETTCGVLFSATFYLDLCTMYAKLGQKL